MPELTFVFGPNNTFFFDSPKSWKFHNIPPTLRQLFNASMNPGWRVQQPYCVALAPQNNSPEPLWYIGCKACDGSDKLFYTQNYFDINYPDLFQWIKSIPNAPSACFLTFGPGLTYFACAPRMGSIWSGVPSDLTDKVTKAYDTPNQVALGVNNAWFVMWPDGYYSWKFYGGYSSLDKILDVAEPRSVAHLALSPYSNLQYFVAFKDRTVKYSLSPEWIPQMQEVFVEWQAEIMRAQGIYRNPSFSYPQTPQTPGTPGYFSPMTPAPPYQYGANTPITPPNPYPGYPSPYGYSPVNGPLVASNPGLPPQMSRDRKDSLKKIGDGIGVAHAVVGIAATGIAMGSTTCNVM